MSRRYCEVCGNAHNNKSEGLCDQHMLEHYQSKSQAEADTHNAREVAYSSFMALDDEDKWSKVFDLLYAKDLL